MACSLCLLLTFATAGGGQVFDLLCLFILLAVTVILRAVRPGFIYYWCAMAVSRAPGTACRA